MVRRGGLTGGIYIDYTKEMGAGVRPAWRGLAETAAGCGRPGVVHILPYFYIIIDVYCHTRICTRGAWQGIAGAEYSFLGPRRDAENTGGAADSPYWESAPFSIAA